MAKHRVTFDLTRDEEQAICSYTDRKERNAAICGFLLAAGERAIPEKVREAKEKELQALGTKYQALKAELEG